MEPPKKLSPNETAKENSNYLRGTIKAQVENESSHFEGSDKDLLKSHGMYQQDDRDLRPQLLKDKKEAAFSLMIRLKAPGGVMSAHQYGVYDDLANQYGNGTLRITTRQGFQFHGVLKKNVRTVLREINKALGTTIGACGDNVRNVLACPAPFKDRRALGIMEYAQKISNAFLAQGGAYHEIWLNNERVANHPHFPETGTVPGTVPEKGDRSVDPVEPVYGKTYLPRKFKIAITFPGDNCVDVYSNDLGILPEIKDGKLLGFNIVVGGGFGQTHGIQTTYPRLASPLCFVQPEDVVAISKAVILVQRDFGNRADRKRARMKYLIDEKGMAWFRTEVEKRFGKKTEDPHPVHWTAIYNHLGWHEDGDGKWFFGLPVESGRLKDEGNFRLKTALRKAVEKFKPVIYLTCQQDIILAGLEAGQKKELEDLLTSHGVKLPSQVSNVRKDSMACPALPTCGLAITESERFLPTVLDQLEQKLKELGLDQQRIMVRMTGCPNGCARPYNAEIAFVGRTTGTYNLYLGGNLTGDRLNFLYNDKVLEKDLAASVYPLFALYKEKRQTGEGFGDFCHRLGADALKASTGASSQS